MIVRTTSAPNDPGLAALAMLLRIHGIAVESEQIQHRMGAGPIGVTEIVRCSRQFGLKARASKSKWGRLSTTPLPAIAALRDGTFLVLGKIADNKVTVQRAASPRPEVLNQAEFEAIWDGRLILMTKRAPLIDLSRRFDITWFLGAIHKYRGILCEVLIASFFLQLFALISPLFFQVVVD